MKKAGVFLIGIFFLWAIGYARRATITITSPKGGESWILNSSQRITWAYTGFSDPAHTYVKIELYKNGLAPTNKVGDIVQNISLNSGSYDWGVGQYEGGTTEKGSSYYVRIIIVGGIIKSDSRPFTIAVLQAVSKISPVEPIFAFIVPDRHTIYHLHRPHEIKWKMGDTPYERVHLMLYDSQPSPRFIGFIKRGNPAYPNIINYYRWEAGRLEDGRRVESGKYKILIATSDGSYATYSDVFEIRDSLVFEECRGVVEVWLKKGEGPLYCVLSSILHKEPPRKDDSIYIIYPSTDNIFIRTIDSSLEMYIVPPGHGFACSTLTFSMVTNYIRDHRPVSVVSIRDLSSGVKIFFKKKYTYYLWEFEKKDWYSNDPKSPLYLYPDCPCYKVIFKAHAMWGYWTETP